MHAAAAQGCTPYHLPEEEFVMYLEASVTTYTRWNLGKCRTPRV